MCGIAGIFHPTGGEVNSSELKAMCDVMRHRGPDDEGMHIDGQLGIGMRRLSIIDLSSGHQPICNEDRTIWVVFNGEIYNYLQLRRELEAKGHKFATNSDTETLVHLYEDDGEDLVKRLNGMFTFALWDSRRRRLVLGRDRPGEKQIYYAFARGKFVFGSEIKCLLQTDTVTRDIDYSALDAYLTFLYTPAPRTIFRDIRELPPAHVMVIDERGMRLRRYWDLQFKIEHRRDEQEYIQAFSEKFRASVKSRLVSDVPLGALLSGGVDSSAVVAAMCDGAAAPVKTFCVGFGDEGSSYDERRYARIVARRFGTEHHELVVKPDIVEVLPRLVDAFDQPFADSSAIANYYVFGEARKHVKVVLSGLGGDEVGAGYERHLGILLHRQWAKLPHWLRAGVIGRVVNVLPEPRMGGRLIDRAKRFVRSAELPPDQAYVGFMTAFDVERRRDFYSKEMRERIRFDEASASVEDCFSRSDIPDALNRALYTDIMTYLPGDLLVLSDRMSMAHSIEARAPFIDHELMEFMATVPPEVKLRGVEKKSLLKQAFAGLLPNEILHRRKQGFTVPLTEWLRNELAPIVREALSKERVEKVGLFSWPAIDRLLSEHARHKENHHARIWALLMFMVWHERYRPT